MTTIVGKWRAAAAWPWSWRQRSGPARSARSQVVAYQPQVASILNGAALQVTPVVSADRRYVRMTLNPYFNTVNGFTTYTAPLARSAAEAAASAAQAAGVSGASAAGVSGASAVVVSGPSGASASPG